jgi:hypothetical protein
MVRVRVSPPMQEPKTPPNLDRVSVSQGRIPIDKSTPQDLADPSVRLPGVVLSKEYEFVVQLGVCVS